MGGEGGGSGPSVSITSPGSCTPQLSSSAPPLCSSTAIPSTDRRPATSRLPACSAIGAPTGRQPRSSRLAWKARTGGQVFRTTGARRGLCGFGRCGWVCVCVCDLGVLPPPGPRAEVLPQRTHRLVEHWQLERIIPHVLYQPVQQCPLQRVLHQPGRKTVNGTVRQRQNSECAAHGV